MHATNVEHGSIGTKAVALIEPEPDEADLEGFLQNVSRIDGVQAEPKPDAFACTNNSCRLREYLAQVQIDGYGKQTLCPIHILDLVDREVGLE